jgi:hypothetical protein
MGHMDQGFKALVDLRTEEMVRFVTGDQQAEYLGTLSADVAMERQLVLDSLYRVRSQGEEHLVDMEAQAYPDAKMARRMYEYGVRANLIHNLPVLSVVVWFFKGEAVPRPPYQIRIGKRVVASWDFINIELYKLPASAIMNVKEVGLLPLVPFTRGATARVVETAMRRIREESAEQDPQKLAALLGVFATRFHGQDFALDLVRRYFMSTELLQEFPLFRSMMAEAEAKGEAKGMREIIARQLEQRFGSLSQEMTAALNAADVPALTELAVHVMTDTQEQLLQRLGLDGQQG